MESAIEENNSYALAKDIVGAILVTLSILGNLTLLVETSYRIRRLQRRSSLYWVLRNLAAADLAVSGVFVPVQMGWISMESASDAEKPWIVEYSGACKIVAFVNLFGLYMHAFSIVSITVDRYLVAMEPSGDAADRARDMVISTLLLSGILSIPDAMAHHVEAVPFIKGGKMCTNFGSWKSQTAELVYALCEASLCAGLPLAAMLICYPSVLVRMRRNMQGDTEDIAANNLRRRPRRNRIGHAHTRTIKLSLILGLGFMICWLPHHVFMLWNWIDFSNHFEIHPGIIIGIQFLTACNPVFNVAIYGYYHACRRRSGAAERRGMRLSRL